MLVRGEVRIYFEREDYLSVGILGYLFVPNRLFRLTLTFTYPIADLATKYIIKEFGFFSTLPLSALNQLDRLVLERVLLRLLVAPATLKYRIVEIDVGAEVLPHFPAVHCRYLDNC